MRWTNNIIITMLSPSWRSTPSSCEPAVPQGGFCLGVLIIFFESHLSFPFISTSEHNIWQILSGAHSFYKWASEQLGRRGGWYTGLKLVKLWEECDATPACSLIERFTLSWQRMHGCVCLLVPSYGQVKCTSGSINLCKNPCVVHGLH